MQRAYRFPAGDCPGYYGFAIPRDGQTPTSIQKPRVTPADASRCLALISPSSTPTPTIAMHEGIFADTSIEKYKVYGELDDQWVSLKHTNDLSKERVKGGTFNVLGG